jgi:hypothetical protein
MELQEAVLFTLGSFQWLRLIAQKLHLHKFSPAAACPRCLEQADPCLGSILPYSSSLYFTIPQPFHTYNVPPAAGAVHIDLGAMAVWVVSIQKSMVTVSDCPQAGPGGSPSILPQTERRTLVALSYSTDFRCPSVIERADRQPME